MKYIYILLLIGFTSCNSKIMKNKTYDDPSMDIHQDNNNLLWLTKLSEVEKDGRKLITYKESKLIKSSVNGDERYIINDQVIFIPNGCSYMKDFYDDSFIIFSMSLNGQGFYAAGYSTFQRDELLIYDIESNKAYQLTLPKPICLLHNKKELINRYNKIDYGGDFDKGPRLYSIDSIDLNQKTINLFGENHKVQKFTLKEVQHLPVVCHPNETKQN